MTTRPREIRNTTAAANADPDAVAKPKAAKDSGGANTDDAASAVAASDTPHLIARCARELFQQGGYSATSIRDVAKAAGVDPALVMRHFHSKDELFVRVIAFDEHFAPPIDGPLETTGVRLVEYLLDPHRTEMRRAFIALVHASDHEAIRLDTQGIMRRLFVDRLSARMSGPDRTLRAWLVSAQLTGLVFSWDAVGDRVTTDEQRHHVATVYGTSIQHLITP